MFEVPLRHIDGDVLFDYAFNARQYQIEVTGACLMDVFRSDGSQEGNEASLRENAEAVLRAAGEKVRRGVFSPIKIRSLDF